MDEPLSSLDAKLRVDLRLEIKRIQRDMGATGPQKNAHLLTLPCSIYLPWCS